MRRTTVGGILATLLVAGLALPAAGATGGRVEFVEPTRLFDTRVASKVTSTELGSGILQVWAIQPDEVGTATIHPCSEAPPPGEITFRLDPNKEGNDFARITTAEKVCLTSTTPLHVIADTSGDVSVAAAAGRSQYIPLEVPVTLIDEPVGNAPQEGLPGDAIELRISRPAALSTDATGIVFSIEAIAPESNGYVGTYGCNDPKLIADITFARNRIANMGIVPLATDEDICLTVLGRTHLRIRMLGEMNEEGPNPAELPPSWRYVASEVPPPSLRPINPTRVLDTRFGTGAPVGKLAADDVLELSFDDLVGPQTSAVTLNVTIAAPEADGFATVWPCGGDQPTVSNLNFVAGQAVPNLVVSKLGPARTICLSTSATAHLIADLNGTYEADGGLYAVPVEPVRILDTRNAIGIETTSRVPAGSTTTLQVTGGDVPAEAGATTVNVTMAGPLGDGFATVYPCDEARPEASNLNFVAGQSVPNLVTAKLSAEGTICIYTTAETHLLADIAAWYGVDQPAGLVELDPERILDTRNGKGVEAPGKVPALEVTTLQVGGVAGVANDADAVVMNVASIASDDDGFTTVWPCDQSMPTVSNLNFSAGANVPNLVTVKLAADGTVCLLSTATTHLLADVTGYLTDEPVDGVELELG